MLDSCGQQPAERLDYLVGYLVENFNADRRPRALYLAAGRSGA